MYLQYKYVYDIKYIYIIYNTAIQIYIYVVSHIVQSFFYSPVEHRGGNSLRSIFI